MSEERAASLRFETAEQLFLLLKPEEEVKKASTTDMSTMSLIGTLMEQQLFVDAIRYLALALPKREAIWWTIAVHKKLSTTSIDDKKELDAWKLVEEWVYNPDEKNRVGALAVAEALEFETAGSYAAMSVYWSGGSLTPAESGQIVLPGPGLSGTAVGASILMTCAQGEAQKVAVRHQYAIKIGLNVAHGGNGLSLEQQ